jgi:hypothetical protein
MSPITLERVDERLDPEWEALVDRAPDATIFHRLAFLAYHPASRFREHRWKARRGAGGPVVAAIALAELAKDGATEWRSPYGGSFGGWATDAGVTLEEHVELVAAVMKEARAAGARALTIATLPAPYLTQGDLAELALVSNGAQCAGEECTHVVDLRGSEEELRARIAGASKRGARKAERLGTAARAGGPEDLARFHALVTESKRELNAAPTHTLEELRAIAGRFPDALTLHVAENAGQLVGGILVFRCNDRAALSFYAIRAQIPEANRAMDLLMERAILDAHRAGHAIFDLGTTTIEGRPNPGLATFKEEWGGRPFVRRRWTMNLS